MKYIFFGTPNFAAHILDMVCAAGIPPGAVVCNPDRPTGRKKIITPPPVKEIAEKWQVKFLQPEKPGDAVAELEGLAPDFFVVAAYSQLLKSDVLGIPKLGTIGVHPSLLPHLRGASPIQSAILRGDRETGLSLYLIDEKMDHGPILAQGKMPIGDLYYSELQAKLSSLAGEMLTKTLPAFDRGEVTPKQQDHSSATFTTKFQREDGFIDPVLLRTALSGESWEAAQEINRKIKALSDEPGTWTLGKAFVNSKIEPEKEVKIIRAKLDDGKLVPEIIQIAGKTPQKYRP